MNPPFNAPRFIRKGIKVHDPKAPAGDALAKQQGLPVSPSNIGEAINADIEHPYEGPEAQNRLKQFGGNNQ